MITVKKIGILTLPLIDNYGGIIQITALNHYLNSLGYETVHLNKKYKISRFKIIVRNLLRWNPFYKVVDINNHAKRDRYIVKMRDFIKKELPNSTKPIYTPEQLRKTLKELDIDAVIVGSDQVWRMLYINDNYEDYFLAFADAKQTRKIAYAASFGQSSWEHPELAENISALLKDFTAVSAREDSGVTICNTVFNIPNAKQALDPTFLPNISYYEDIIEREFNQNKDIDLFNYILDKTPRKNAIIKDISESLNLREDAIYLDNNLKDFQKIGVLKPAIGEWLYHFKKAKFIVTDSFHGTVFSIIFNKQFLTIGNESRGLTRFTSLLNALGLADRLILEDEPNYKERISSPIDYITVNKKLEQLKLESISFLKDSLS